MIIAALAALGLLHFQQPTVRLYQQPFGDWRVNLRQDAFAGRTECTLFAARKERGTRVSYEGGRVVFRFGPHVETRDAWYQVDGGPARSAAIERLPTPIRYSSSATIDSSSGGFVFVPADALAGARRVHIRPNARAGVRRFRVEGLEQALAFVQARGCALQAVE